MPRRPLLVVPALVLLLVLGVRTRGAEHRETAAPLGDARQPLPLPPAMAEHQKRSMREHLAAVQAIVAALGRDDLPTVAAAAGRLGFSEATGRMCEHMGAAAPGFTAMALDFHHTADGIGEAARRGDRTGVLAALDRTLQACVRCHAAYRQDVVDDATWKRLAGGGAR
ncbi:MAG TPA: hypothetical protein VFD84_06150 [Candidatus Binatia bacterium]|jgi:hypothetical protein|nr:hypothetical protein [Candidatus Binatia bacterium]